MYVNKRNESLILKIEKWIVYNFDLELFYAYKLVYLDQNINDNMDGKSFEGHKWVLCNRRWIPLLYICSCFLMKQLFCGIKLWPAQKSDLIWICLLVKVKIEQIFEHVKASSLNKVVFKMPCWYLSLISFDQ